MHLPHCLYCSVCQTELWSKSQWLQHLSTEKHQGLARELCVREWGSVDEAGVKMRKRCLLIFSSFPLTPSSGGALKIVHHFSKKPGVFVTDFLCWEERPCFAILQYESGKIVKEVFLAVPDSELVIDSQLVQIKLGRDFKNLEWSAILPPISVGTTSLQLKRTLEASSENVEPPTKRIRTGSFNSSLESLSKDLEHAVGNLNVYLKRIAWSPPEYRFTKDSTIKNIRLGWLCSVVVNGVQYTPELDPTTVKTLTRKQAQRLAALFCYQVLVQDYGKKGKGVPPNQVANRENPIITRNITSPFQTQFQNALSSVTVPEEKYNAIWEASQRLQTLLQEMDPCVIVVPFRNFHLRLTNPDWESLNEVLLFCYSTQSGFTCVPGSILKRLFWNANQQEFSVLHGPNTEVFQVKLGGTYRYLKTGLEFTLVNAKRLIVEVQTCRLLEYMITFDPRCHSLMALTFFWTRVNGVSFGDLNCDNRVGHVNFPEPLTTEWLVIHFLCYQGLIPSVREIQQRPHTVLRDAASGVDIGFESDPDFAREWKSTKKNTDSSLPLDDPYSEHFILSVLKLFQEFLEFFGQTLGEGQWILNTRDGEVINTDDFLRANPGPSSTWQSRMSPTDLFGLRAIQAGPSVGVAQTPELAENGNKAIKDYYKSCLYRVDYRVWKMYIVHPFIFTLRFCPHKSLSSVLHLMARSSKQLKKFLNASVAPEETLESVLIADKS